MSSSIFSAHGSTPPKSERRTVGGAYSFDVLPVLVDHGGATVFVAFIAAR
jgi:hypothetical protein